jgi:hypothetical protein
MLNVTPWLGCVVIFINFMTFIIGSQNLPTDDVGTHFEATDGTVNISNDLPPSPTHVTPPLRIELIGNTTSIE